MLGPGRQGTLVDGQPLEGGLLECLAEASERIAIVRPRRVRLALDDVRGHVQPGRVTCARECDVAPLLEARLAGAEHEGALDGDALAGVASERGGVAYVPPPVATGQPHASATVGLDRERAAVRIDLLDGSAGAVSDAEY